MKKKVFYLFAHQDDEFGIFIQLKKDIENNEPYVFYLTSGSNKNIDKKKLYFRDKESLKNLLNLGVKQKNIFFIGRKLEIKNNKLYLNAKKVINFFENSILKKIKPSTIYTHSWEGGHEDHDACNLIARKLRNKFKIINCYQFSQYNSFNTSLFFFKVFNPIKKNNGFKIYTNLFNRIKLILLLFNYKSQIKVWFGLYPFIISHYLFKGFNFIEKLEKSNKIIKPHSGKLLYEKRNFCRFSIFKKKMIFIFK